MMLTVNKAHPEFDISIVLGASGTWGCGAVIGCSWFQLRWAGLGTLVDQNITIKELLPSIVAAAVWGAGWADKTVRSQCDNTVVAAMVNSRSSKEREALRCLAFLEAIYSLQHT